MMRDRFAWWVWMFIAAGAVIASRPALAVDNEYRYSSPLAWRAAAYPACQELQSEMNGGLNGHSCHNNGGTLVNAHLTGTRCDMDCQPSSGPLQVNSVTASVLTRAVTGERNCPAAGSPVAVGHTLNSSFSASGHGCRLGCEVLVDPGDVSAVASGSSTAIGFGTSTGRSCGATGVTQGDYVPEYEEVASACQRNERGDNVCMEEATNCGLYNGDRVCMETVEDGCVAYESGGVACFVDTGGATAPPHPDSGTPGDPADPDMQVTDDADTINYYDDDTVGNSTGAPAGAGGGEPGDAPGQGGAPGGGGSGGGGGGTGDGDIEVEIDFGEGTLPTDSLETECDFAGCAQQFWTRVEAAPILAAVGNVGASVPTGSCPSYDLEAFGESFSLSAPMCAIWDDIAPVLSVLFLIVWAWVSTRIVLSA